MIDEMRPARFYTERHSPVGSLRLTTDGKAITGIELESVSGKPRGAATEQRSDDHPVLLEAARQLEAYFSGGLTAFSLTVAPAGTPFQRKVWRALQGIPWGQAISYGELARRIGSPGSARAVGMANGRNPVAIVIPCHRVIGADGSLTGYGGGLDRKKWLLAHEGVATPAIGRL